MPKSFDASLKKALEQNPSALMRLAGLEPAGPIIVVNSDLSTVTAEADLVFRVEETEPDGMARRVTGRAMRPSYGPGSS